VSSPSRGRHFEAPISPGLDTMSLVGSNFSVLFCLSLICFVRRCSQHFVSVRPFGFIYN
jgi:hypothetical protein